MNKLTDSWDDLVFEYRHKDYGAYILRYNYPVNVTVSALVVIVFFVSGMVGLKLFGERGTEASGDKTTRIDYIDYVALKTAPPIEKIHLPEPPVVKYAVPKVIQEEVNDNEMMPTKDQVAAALEPVQDIIINPEFPGGTDALMKWLNENLRYPAIASLIGIEGKVVVEFTVDENGKISEVIVTESLHKVCDREAMRLVKAMPDWIPGTRNGGKITQRYILPIRFVLQ